MMRYLLLFFLCALTIDVMAQPPNDDCGDAISVMMDISYDFTTVGATTDGPKHPSASCFGATNDSIPHDVWYTFTSPISGEIKWTNCGTADFDSRIVVYQAGIGCDPGPDDFLECNDDGPTSCSAEFFTSELTFVAVEGETYLLRMGGYAADTIAEGSGTFILELVEGGPPNNLCNNAIEITLGEDQNFTTLEATTDGPDHPGNPCFGFGSITATNDVWYTFTPDFTGAVQWSTCNQINFDSRLAVYGPNVSCPVSDEDLYSCNDDGASCDNYSSLLVFEVEAGQTYLLRLGGFGGDQGLGTFDLIEVTPPMPPANDLCAEAGDAYIITREVADNFEDLISGTTLDGTFESEDYVYPICLGNQNGGEFSDVWYSFNTLGNEFLELRLLLANDIENSAFYMDVFASCDEMVDTSVVLGSCLNVDVDNQLAVDTLTGFEMNTDLFIRVTTRLTSDAPGDFAFQIVGDIVSGVNDPDFLQEVSFFPNPVSNMATLRFGLEESRTVNARILNTLGQEVRTQYLGHLASGAHNIEMNLQDLQPGIYLLNISDGTQQQNLKFIKQ